MRDVVRRLLPAGSGPSTGHGACPDWPPDVFAIAATIVNLSGCYARHHLSGELRSSTIAWGKAWRDSRVPPAAVKRMWRSLARLEDEVTDPRAGSARFWEPALALMAAADEASVGIGFYSETAAPSMFSEIAEAALIIARSKATPRAEDEEVIQKIRELLPYIPHSLGSLVPDIEACVQPKSRTAQVGCTLRSLSHHLALLPPKGEVRTHWWSRSSRAENEVNLLLVPFPYRVDASVFEESEMPGATGKYLAVNQSWLRSERFRETFLRFVRELIRHAETADGGRVHGLVLPEMSLDLSTARAVGDALLAEGLELFVAGAWDPASCKNVAYTAVDGSLAGREGTDEWTQAKHHRWRLDRRQIEGYGLAHVLDAGKPWWEKTELGEREVYFHVFRPGATLSVLVCEDLARVDPAQSVLRAVGTNLVVALLMDGPQLRGRWPARAATALADDPGSSVLTLTSAGMERRASRVYAERTKTELARRLQIGMWKEAGGDVEELSLDGGDHALLLSLAFGHQESFTLDGRSDDARTVTISLAQRRPVRQPQPPAWA